MNKKQNKSVRGTLGEVIDRELNLASHQAAHSVQSLLGSYSHDPLKIEGAASILIAAAAKELITEDSFVLNDYTPLEVEQIVVSFEVEEVVGVLEEVVMRLDKMIADEEVLIMQREESIKENADEESQDEESQKERIYNLKFNSEVAKRSIEFLKNLKTKVKSLKFIQGIEQILF